MIPLNKAIWQLLESTLSLSNTAIYEELLNFKIRLLSYRYGIRQDSNDLEQSPVLTIKMHKPSFWSLTSELERLSRTFNNFGWSRSKSIHKNKCKLL